MIDKVFTGVSLWRFRFFCVYWQMKYHPSPHAIKVMNLTRRRKFYIVSFKQKFNFSNHFLRSLKHFQLFQWRFFVTFLFRNWWSNSSRRRMWMWMWSTKVISQDYMRELLVKLILLILYIPSICWYESICIYHPCIQLVLLMITLERSDQMVL